MPSCCRRAARRSSAPGRGAARSATRGGALELREARADRRDRPRRGGGPRRPGVDDGSNLVPDYRRSSVDTGGLVLATAARHDLIAEASGGAEPGTAVTAATPIDVLAADASAELAADDTFTLAVLPDAAEAGGADSPPTRPMATSPGSRCRRTSRRWRSRPSPSAIATGRTRRSDPATTSVRWSASVRSSVPDCSIGAVFAPPAAADPGDRARRARARALSRRRRGRGRRRAPTRLIGDSRQVVIAYLGALAAPIAASAGLAHPLRRRDAGAHLRSDRLRQVVPDCVEIREPRRIRRACRRGPRRRRVGRAIRERPRPRAGRPEPEREDQDQALAARRPAREGDGVASPLGGRHPRALSHERSPLPAPQGNSFTAKRLRAAFAGGALATMRDTYPERPPK